jgi:hypothetical protein
VAFERPRTPGFQRVAGVTADEIQRWADQVAADADRVDGRLS